jgi:hypothetical protein
MAVLCCGNRASNTLLPSSETRCWFEAIAKERAESGQNRSPIASGFRRLDALRVLHVLWFGLWIGLGVEKYPYGLLTMIVSLEAIFLSTFVMISQNRADAKRQVDRRPAVDDR